jgi:predicted choloylglycine hydrolase
VKRIGLPFIAVALLIVCSNACGAARVIELRGESRAIGADHGKALGNQIRELREKYLLKLIDTAPKRLASRAAASLFQAKLLPEHQAEVAALADATRVDLADIMLGQCFLDLMPMTACSTIALPADAAPDHVARLGRNLDFKALGIADKLSVVLVYHPAGRNAFVSIGWPGMIGVLSGLNERGLCLANMEVTRIPRLPTAMPYTMLYRTILEQCGDVDEAIALLEKTPRQTPNNLMLMDARGNRAVVEITPENVVVRRGKDGAALVSTNHQRNQDDDTPGRCRRYDCLHDSATADFGQIDADHIRAMLKSVSQGEMTMQSMILEPANRVIYLSTGKHAADGEFERIDLKSHL